MHELAKKRHVSNVPLALHGALIKEKRDYSSKKWRFPSLSL